MATKQVSTEKEKQRTLKDDMNMAHWCISNREYGKAKDLLLQIITHRESDSYRIFYMLGVVAFSENDIITANKHFHTVLQKMPHHIVSILYIATIALLNGKKQEALQHLMNTKSELLLKTKGQNSKYIENALKYIKQYASDEETLLEIFNNPYKNKLLPEFGIIRRKKRIVRNFTMLFIILGGAIFGGIYLYMNVISDFFTPENTRTLTYQTIEENFKKQDAQAQKLNEVYITLSDRAYKKLLKGIKNDFIHYRDNLLQIKVNTVLYSNRSPKEKNKVSVILQNVHGIGYTSDVTWFEYDDIQNEMWKYEHVVVKWKGTIAKVEKNIESENNAFMVSTQFLVNYYGDNKELKESIPLYFTQDIDITNGTELEVLAKIRLDKITRKQLSLETIAYKYILENK